jgi:hypothetical protein
MTDLLSGLWMLAHGLLAIVIVAPWSVLVLAMLVTVGLQEALRRE